MLELLIITIISFIGATYCMLHNMCNPKEEDIIDMNDYSMEENNNGETIDDITQIEIVNTKLDLSNIPEYLGAIKSYNFTPQYLQEYIGQKKAKQIIQLNLKKIDIMNPPHYLISSIKGGVGKTTLGFIIANMLQAKLIDHIGADFEDPKVMEKILYQINSESSHTVLLIDEIQNLSKKTAEQYFYKLLENFTIQGKKIKPFTCVACTTDKDVLMRYMQPFVTRFKAPIELEQYNIDDLIKILKQYKRILFDDIIINEEIYTIIAKNCKYTPRIGLGLIEDYIILKNIDKVLECHGIMEGGLTKIDANILKILQNKKPMGAGAIAQMAKLNKSSYEYIYEPFLVEEGYIYRTLRGRVISEKGMEFIERRL